MTNCPCNIVTEYSEQLEGCTLSLNLQVIADCTNDVAARVHEAAGMHRSSEVPRLTVGAAKTSVEGSYGITLYPNGVLASPVNLTLQPLPSPVQVLKGPEMPDAPGALTTSSLQLPPLPPG